jgi:hypothetical protein
VDFVNGKLAEENGVTFLHEGVHAFNLKSGASFKVYASPYTPEFGGWAFQDKINEDRFNPGSETPDGTINIATDSSIIPPVDIVMTHGPAKYILDDTPSDSAGSEHLRRALCRAQPRIFASVTSTPRTEHDASSMPPPPMPRPQTTSSYTPRSTWDGIKAEGRALRALPLRMRRRSSVGNALWL